MKRHSYRWLGLVLGALLGGLVAAILSQLARQDRAAWMVVTGAGLGLWLGVFVDRSTCPRC
ncbi:MAG: hypothetical protein ABFD20_10185 [Anaerolineales bacterium]